VVVGNFGSIHAKPQDRSSATYPERLSWCCHGGSDEETMKAALENYHDRMQRVLDHIDQHLDDDLGLEAVSGIAAFSKFHFHRQFTATFGLSVHRYVQLARMKRASYRLAYRDVQSVTDIAMDAGYDAPDAFARAFRRRFGQSPSSFRKSPIRSRGLRPTGLSTTLGASS
jgi:AraC-like DNA-binding protein